MGTPFLPPQFGQGGTSLVVITFVQAPVRCRMATELKLVPRLMDVSSYGSAVRDGTPPWGASKATVFDSGS